MFQFRSLSLGLAFVVIISTTCAHAQKSQEQCSGEYEFWGCQSPTRECQRLCENYKKPASGCQLSCFKSCVCIAGYRRRGVEGECVFETECQDNNNNNNNHADQEGATTAAQQSTPEKGTPNDTNDDDGGLDKVREHQKAKERHQIDTQTEAVPIEETIMNEGDANNNNSKKKKEEKARPAKDIETTRPTKDEHDGEEEEDE